MNDGYVRFNEDHTQATIDGVIYGSHCPMTLPVLDFNKDENMFVVKFPGHTGYVDRMTGNKYVPPTYYVFRFEESVESSYEDGGTVQRRIIRLKRILSVEARRAKKEKT